MLRIPKLRLILEPQPYSGRWNMAVDETLLETAISAEIPTLRWYQWSEPTVSLGYFQKFEELVSDPILSQLPVVRRLSGGGAIIHDDELTYCLTLPASQTLFDQPHQLYDIVHVAVESGLRHLGIPVTLRGSTYKLPEEPLLCFQRQDEHDLTLLGKKVLGSAQRRRRGAIMQHGSLIRYASKWTRQIPGIGDLCNTTISDQLTETLAMYVARAVSDSWFFGELNTYENEMVKEIFERTASSVRSR